MIEEPEKNQLPEPAGEPAPDEIESGGRPERTGSGSLIRRVTDSLRRATGSLRQPAEGSEAGDKPTSGRLGPPKPVADQSYINDIRQTLASEETEKPQQVGFFRRITRSLRRDTRSLPPPEPEQPPAAAETSPAEAGLMPPAAPAEIEDDFLAGRLGDSATDAAIEMGAGDTLISAWPAMDQDAAAPGPYGGEDLATDELADGGAALTGTGPSEPDWVIEMRQGGVEEASPPPSADDTLPVEPGTGAERESTGRLRSLITGIFGSQEEKHRQGGENDVPDELLAGRLGLSLGSQPPEAAVADAVDAAAAEPEPEPPAPGWVRQAAVPGEDLWNPYEEEAEADVDLGARFGQVMDAEALEEAGAFMPEADLADAHMPDADLEDSAPGTVGPATAGPGPDYQLSAEDEALLWGEPEADRPEEPTPRVVTPAEVDEPPFDLPPLGRTGIFRQLSDQEIAASFLAGADVEPFEEAPPPPPARDPAIRAEEAAAFEDMRAIVLEGYRDSAPPPHPRAESEPAEQEPEGEPLASGAPVEPEEAAEALAEAEDRGWMAQLARSTTLQKVFLLEVALVVVALVLVAPFFFRALNAGPAERLPVVAPRALPDGVPYPTGVTLPGGWYFKLEKSTFVDGAWQPVRGEWLEGTELRRVVALPWSLQTEAVIQTFQKGDPVTLYLNNQTRVQYRVDAVERVQVSNVDILTDNKPSLLLVLHKEDAQERWIIIARP